MRRIPIISRIIDWWADRHFITFAELLLKKGTCCICGSKLKDPHEKIGHFSFLQIFKRAKWDEPIATVTTGTDLRNNDARGTKFTITRQSHSNFAVSVVCAQCESINNGNSDDIRNKVKYAIEWHKNNIVYHDVKLLEDYPLVIEAAK